MTDRSSLETCPQCRGRIQPADVFCAHCGSPLATGEIRCPDCGAKSPADSQFCSGCGKPRKAGAPAVRRCRWYRSPEEVAVRFEADNLAVLLHGFTDPDAPSWTDKLLARFAVLLKAGFVVEEGTLALVLQTGVAEVLGPGRYWGETLDERFARFVDTQPVSLVLADGSTVELPMHIDNLLTAEYVRLSAEGRIAVSIADLVRFHNEVLKGTARLTRVDLARRFEPEVRLSLLDALGGKPFKELRPGAAVQEQLRELMDRHLRESLAPWGLQLEGVRGLMLRGEAIERFQSQRGALFERNSQLELDVLADEIERQELRHRANAELESLKIAHQREQAVQREELAHAQSLGQIDEERQDSEADREVSERRRAVRTQVKTAETVLGGEAEIAALDVGQAEKLSVLHRRAQSIQLDRMRSEEDVARFMAEFDKNKALRDDDVETIKRGLWERREDAELARQYLLERVALEQELENERIRLEKTRQFDRSNVEHELAVQRSRFETTQAEAWARHEQATRMRRDDIKLKQDEDLADLATAAKARELHWADKDRASRAERESAEHAVDMEQRRLDARSKASVAALLSLLREQGGPQGNAEADRALEDLARSEQFKGMDVDQILAIQAGDSPEVAKIFQQRALALGCGEKVRIQMEAAQEALEHERRHSRELRELSEKHVEMVLGSTDRAMQRVADIAQTAAASQHGETVVVSSPAGAIGQQATIIGRQSAPVAEAQIACPQCGAAQRAAAVHCDQCGTRLKSARCDACGEPLEPAGKFCTKCGNPVQRGPA